MNQVPHITEPTQIEKQYAIEAAKAADFGENWLVTANRALSIQNIAYQSACGNDEANAEQEQPLITAEEARKLGAGKAEWSYNDTSNRWFLCTDQCFYPAYLQYRAIKPKPVEPHAELKANLVKLDGELMTRDAAWRKISLSDKDLFYLWDESIEWLLSEVKSCGELNNYDFRGAEYQLREKPTVKLTIDNEPANISAQHARKQAIEDCSNFAEDWAMEHVIEDDANMSVGDYVIKSMELLK